MPKIVEATVAEHRAARRAALLDAAVTLLHERPEEIPGLAAVGKRAGLSRSSVYHYFSSREDLLAQVVEHTFPRWEQRFQAAYAAEPTSAGRVRAFVRENIGLVSDGEHALARTLAAIAPAEHMGRHSADFHQRLVEPLTEALAEIGSTDAELTAQLVNALVHSGARQVESGADAHAVMAGILEILDPYLAARGDTASSI
ncbi:TetR/AcrR family transcriptional regulator [Demequina lutea]|uniref:AcrR family transcriptional regulator n=1 Tax=Demequina lutea TaxID=431489 RepID=A0A7Y9ZBE7_9MICO|nr:TetR/AcrR family transcriptional regulator [Demequina lutea]NYI41750.1 AcrR family transcriptional regulator [Demequina lutea]